VFKESTNPQNSESWLLDRLGKITASNAPKLITKTGKKSSSAEELINRAVAERIIGKPEETYVSPAMERGSDLEDSALDFINFTYEFSFKKAGFLDSGKGYGCSPDGIDHHKKIGLEIKCPLSWNHLSYVVGGKLPDKYIQQIQFSLLVTGFDTWIFSSYHPDLKSFLVEVKRDEEYINKMQTILDESCALIKLRYEKYSDYKREF